MHYNFFHTNKSQTDTPMAKEPFLTAPALGYLHELLISYLQDLAFYLLKLKELGITNEKIKKNVIEVVSSIMIGTNYTQEQFSKIISTLYADFSQAKELYLSICKKNNIEADFLKSTLKNPEKFNFPSAISLGQKISSKKNEQIGLEKKTLFELMFNVLKSICINLIELEELEVEDDKAYKMVLSLFSVNPHNSSIDELNRIIDEAVEFDHSLLKKLSEIKEQKYGKIVQKEVRTTTMPNKAILVSGTSLRELELLLEATKNRNIDIYTHGQMLIAHLYPKLKNYPHLVGHFGKGIETYLPDFTEFHGAILITKHSFQKVENFYRGKIFTTDVMAPPGVKILRDNDFEPLIQSALSDTGFTQTTERPPIKIHLSEEKVLKEITEVAEKMKKGEIKHFIAIGVANHTKSQKDYFEKFFHIMPDDCFALSFSYSNSKKNILCVESAYSFTLLYKILDVLTSKISLEDLNLTILFTRCEIHTLSNVLYLKHIGVKNIYFSDCSHNFVNPTLINSMRKMFDIKSYTNPESDMKSILRQ